MRADEVDNYRYSKCTIFSKEPFIDGCECFNSNESLDEDYYVKTVKLCNIKHVNGKFYYTTEDLYKYADQYPEDMLPVIGAFVKSKKGKRKVSKSFITDVSGLPAFNVCTACEDVKIHTYRLYITLFNDFNVKQCRYDRYKLYDALYKSSKYDLESKIQNSEFLKSKDFTVINLKRKDKESIPVALVLQEPEDDEYSNVYGTLFIDMNNILSIKWH